MRSIVVGGGMRLCSRMWKRIGRCGREHLYIVQKNPVNANLIIPTNHINSIPLQPVTERFRRSLREEKEGRGGHWGCPTKEIADFRDECLALKPADQKLRWLSAGAEHRMTPFKRPINQEGIFIMIYSSDGEYNITRSHFGALGIDFDSQIYAHVGGPVPKTVNKLLQRNGVTSYTHFRQYGIVAKEPVQKETECGGRACVFAKWFASGHTEQLTEHEFLHRVDTLMERWRGKRQSNRTPKSTGKRSSSRIPKPIKRYDPSTH